MYSGQFINYSWISLGKKYENLGFFFSYSFYVLYFKGKLKKKIFEEDKSKITINMKCEINNTGIKKNVGDTDYSLFWFFMLFKSIADRNSLYNFSIG